MERFPSRGYMTPRTRIIRRLYLGAAILVIILIIGIVLFNLSDKTQEEQPAAAAPERKVIEPEKKAVTVTEPPRMVQPLPPAPTQQQAPPQPIEKPEVQAPVVTEQPAVIQPAEQPSLPAATGITAMINEALALLNERPAKVIEARDRLNELLPLEMTPQQRMLVKQQLSALADVWLFSPTVYPKDTLCEIYQVKPGDLLKEIGRVNNVPWEIIQELNKISRPEALQVGQTLKIVKGPFHARVFRSKFIMDLYLQDTYVKSFTVGLGKPEHETPTGTWVAKPGGKLIKPTWTDPDTGKTYQADDPDYPLGSRWIGLDGISGNATGRTGFALHGTQKPDEIGSATSRGCIRLHNGDVLLIYNLMMPGASRVEVVD